MMTDKKYWLDVTRKIMFWGQFRPSLLLDDSLTEGEVLRLIKDTYVEELAYLDEVSEAERMEDIADWIEAWCDELKKQYGQNRGDAMALLWATGRARLLWWWPRKTLQDSPAQLVEALLSGGWIKQVRQDEGEEVRYHTHFDAPEIARCEKVMWSTIEKKSIRTFDPQYLRREARRLRKTEEVNKPQHLEEPSLPNCKDPNQAALDRMKIAIVDALNEGQISPDTAGNLLDIPPAVVRALTDAAVRRYQEQEEPRSI